MKQIVLLVLLGFWSLLAVSAEKVVTVATLTNNPPFTFNQDAAEMVERESIPPGFDSQRLQGYSWDVLKESFHEMGYTIQLSVFPWIRALTLVKAGKLDVLFPAGLNKERTGYFNYSNEPINHVDFLIYVRADSTMKWQGLESLNGKTIGVLRGWNYGSKWREHHEIYRFEVGEILQGFSMLDRGRLDGLAGYELNFDYALKQSNWKKRYKKMPVFDSSDEFAVAAKLNPKGLKFLADFDEGKRRITEKGILRQIAIKWQGLEPFPE